jgi:hypothetical protein
VSSFAEAASIQRSDREQRVAPAQEGSSPLYGADAFLINARAFGLDLYVSA